MSFIKLKNIRNNSFARNSLILFAGSIVGNILNYFFHLYVGRMVSPEIYGEFESLNALLVIIAVPAAALTMLATKYSAHAKAENDTHQTFKLLSFLNKKVFIFILPIFVIAIFLTPEVAKFLKIESNFAIILFWLLMFLSFIGAVNGGIMTGWQKFKDASWIGILGALVKLISVIILLKIGLSLEGIVGSFFLGSLFTYLATFYALRFIFKRNTNTDKNAAAKIDFKSMKAYILPVLFGNLALNIFGNIDMVLAKHNLAPDLAGQYGALTIVSKIIFFGTGIVATILFTMAAERNHQERDSFKLFTYAAFLVLGLSLFATFIYFIAPKFILSILFGSRYSLVSHYLVWFAVLVTLFSLVNLIAQYLLSIHETKFVYLYLVIAVVASTGVLVAGNTISAILWIMITAQSTALVSGLFFLKKERKIYEQVDFYSGSHL